MTSGMPVRPLIASAGTAIEARSGGRYVTNQGRVTAPYPCWPVADTEYAWRNYRRRTARWLVAEANRALTGYGLEPRYDATRLTPEARREMVAMLFDPDWTEPV